MFVMSWAVMIPVEASWAQTLSTCSRPGMPEGHHDPAAVLLDQLLGRDGQVLEARARCGGRW